MADEDPPTPRAGTPLPRFKVPPPVVIREVKPKSDREPMSQRIKATAARWTPGAIAALFVSLGTAIGTVAGSLGGPEITKQVIATYLDNSRKLDEIKTLVASRNGDLGRVACLLSNAQREQAIQGRNLSLAANFLSELNGAPPNESFPHGAVKRETAMGEVSIKFPTRWEAAPEMPPCGTTEKDTPQ